MYLAVAAAGSNVIISPKKKPQAKRARPDRKRERLRAVGDCLRMANRATELAPMEALLAAELPDGDGWQYEPKWDGFRCLARRDDDQVTLTSKSGKPLARY